jgi:hypothetical protein
MRITIFLAILLSLLPSAVFSKDNIDEYIIDRLDWQESYKASKTIRVENMYGNIHIKKSFDGSFIYHAVAQNHKDRKEKIKLLIEDSNAVTTLKIQVPNNGITGKERVDVALLVPAHVNLIIEMDAAEFRAKKIHNPIKLTSNKTNIEVSTSSSFDILSKGGTIYVELLDNSTEHSSKIQGYSSDITVKYNEISPFFDIVSGKKVVSNSAQLLNSRKQVKRNKYFNNPQSPTKISIISDTGRIILINNHN